MILKIHKGHHRPPLLQWLSQIGLFFKPVMARRVCFYGSCKYDLPGIEDDQDVNKLFGFGFLPGHHKHSARVGWWYDASTNRIVLMAYCYVNGERVIQHLCDALIYEVYDVFIYNDPDSYRFVVRSMSGKTIAEESVLHGKKRSIGYKLALFFGGNNPAPNNMTIQIKKI